MKSRQRYAKHCSQQVAPGRADDRCMPHALREKRQKPQQDDAHRRSPMKHNFFTITHVRFQPSAPIRFILTRSRDLLPGTRDEYIQQVLQVGDADTDPESHIESQSTFLRSAATFIGTRPTVVFKAKTPIERLSIYATPRGIPNTGCSSGRSQLPAS